MLAGEAVVWVCMKSSHSQLWKPLSQFLRELEGEKMQVSSCVAVSVGNLTIGGVREVGWEHLQQRDTLLP